MSQFKFKCPQCGREVTAEESIRGMVAECPHCGKGIVIPRNAPPPVVGKSSTLGLRRKPTAGQ